MLTAVKYSVFSIVLIFSAIVDINAAKNFRNPVTRNTDSKCHNQNFVSERFAPNFSLSDRSKICSGLEKITLKLNSTEWSDSLAAELRDIWNVFAFQNVTIRPMPESYSSQTIALAEPFTSKIIGKNFEASIYLRADKAVDESFFLVLFHELRHVYDFYETWSQKQTLSGIELERRGFRLMGKITRETPENENFRSLPKFWKDSWRKLSEEKIASNMNASVEKYLKSKRLYRKIAESNQLLDFSSVKESRNNNIIPASADRRKDDAIKLPSPPALPDASAVIEQKIDESDFELQKPSNVRDEKEILRVALSNEKKLYYGMSNFVYDQKLRFECRKNGKKSYIFTNENTIARTENGKAFFESGAAAANEKLMPCGLNFKVLESDFTETFWSSPALEKMPIKFVGFVQADGVTLARYTVLRPSEKLYAQLAREYQSINPFRVFVGTIFVSAVDGQIVKFWGSSFPSSDVTGNNPASISGSYGVTAVRQKVNISGGVWMTVFIGTSAIANLEKNPTPYSYTVNLENFRQTKTDVQILDDDDNAAVTEK